MSLIMLEEHLKKYFGFDSFKKGQKEVIDNLLNFQSAAAIFPTGAGKSLCYQLPAMLLPKLTLVVSPLLSLMKDQIDFLKEKNIPAARLDSTLPKEEYENILEDAKKGNLKILMISVERFRNERFRNHLQKIKISLLVIDEAHCISEWGHNFRPDYLKLPAYQNEFAINQILLLTATATQKVIDDMCNKFSLLRKNVTVTGFYRRNLFLGVSPVSEFNKKDELLKRINQFPTSPTIVYVTLQKTAANIAEFLKSHNVNSSPYHAGMKNEEREQIQNSFMKSKLDCVVATIAFGMGIDKKDIRRIIHYDFPKSIENYSQEIGRSGRDGEKSYCEVLANRDHLNTLENFIYGDTPDENSIFQLLSSIKNNNGRVWEVKLIKLSKEFNIRLLTLKTLLVYLEMEDIIKPKYTYFGEYFYKYIIEPSKITEKFNGERNDFVKSIIDNCQRKKIWTYVDMDEILKSYKSDRKRVISALEYFNQMGWIELNNKNSIDVYDIVNSSYDINNLTKKLFDLFKSKEEIEIKRIHNLVAFFESEKCINKNLAEYFGENIEFAKCGHCSFCKKGKVEIKITTELKPLSSYDFIKLTNEFNTLIGEDYSILNLTKFLCGVYTPIFTKYKIKSLANFGTLERYPFFEVKNWINKNNKPTLE